MFNQNTFHVLRRWRYAFVLVAALVLLPVFTLGVGAEEVVFKVKFQGEDMPPEYLVALIFTARLEYCTVYQGATQLGGELQPGDYIAWIYMLEEYAEREYGDDVFRQPGQRVIDFTVKEGVTTVENVNLPTAQEFIQGPDFARVLQLSSSMLWGAMFGGGVPDDVWDSDYYDYDYDNGYDYYYEDYEYDWDLGDWGIVEWGTESGSSYASEYEQDDRPDLRPYGPEYD
jgi:hypothetical protein